MPIVPRQDGPSVGPNTLPQARFDAPNMPDVAGAQMRQFGQGMEQAGHAAANIATDMQQQANELRVTDALNKAKEASLRLTYDKDAGFTNLRGINALERPDGKPLAQEYGDALQKHLDDIAGTLGNEEQKQLFAKHVGGVKTAFVGQVVQHEANEFKTYGLSVSEGVMSTAIQDISLNWRDPEAVDKAVTRIKAETYRQAQLLGKSAEWQEAQARKLSSTGHKTVLLAALEQNDPAYADAYLKKYSPQMEADDILAVRSHITNQMDAQIGASVAGDVVRQAAPRMQQTDFSRMVTITLGTESNGQRYADYGYGKRPDGTPKGRGFLGELKRPDGKVSTEISVGVNIGGKEMDIPTLVPTLTKAEVSSLLKGDRPSDAIVQKAVDHAKQRIAQGKSVFADPELLTSPKGAKGEMQVLDGTSLNPGFGVKPAADNSPDERARVGRDYLDAMLKRYGGDPSKAWAAYNAGPGRVDAALKNAEKPVMINASADPNAPKKIDWLALMPQETQKYVAKNMAALSAGGGELPRPTFAEIDDRLRADPRLAGNPARYKLAREEASRQFEEQTKAIKQREEDAVAVAMRGVLQNGGRFTDLPASVRGAIPPKEVDNVLAFAQKISKGDDTTSLWLYNKLTGNPAALASMSDSEFFALRRELSESDFKHFSNERAKLTGSAPGANGPGDLNSGAIKQTLDSRLRMLKMDPTPKDDGGADAARIGGIRQFVDQYFISAQREAGKKFTDAEVAQHIDALFAKNATFRGWFSDTSGPVLGMKIGDIDSAAKDNIKAAFKRRGVDSPTDAQIMNAYWNMKYARK